MKKYQLILFIILILVIASFFRLWHLNSVPPGVYPDEAINGNNAIQALTAKNYKLFYPENNGREGLFINLIAVCFGFVGIHIWSLKLISALAGILTVLGLYLLAKELFKSSIIGLLSSFFLAISFWHINFSRIAFRAILVPLLLVWSFYLLYKGMNAIKNKDVIAIICLFLSGIFFGLGFHTYIAFRMAVLLLIVPLVAIVIRFVREYKIDRRPWFVYFKKRFWQYDLWIIAVLIAALPMGIYFLNNPGDFMGRAGGVSIFTQEHPFEALISSTIKTIGMFNIAGDFNWRHNFSGSPQLLWPIGIFFILGLIICIARAIKYKSSNYWLLLVWFAAMLLPAILTYEGLPHALRAIGVIPVCYIFAAIGAYFLFKQLFKFVSFNKLNKGLFTAFCILVILGCSYAQFDKYFINWARQPDVKNAFASSYVKIGNYLNDLPSGVNKYVIVNQSGVLINGIPMPAQTVMFIENTQQRNQQTKYLLPEKIEHTEFAERSVIIPLQYNLEIFRELKQKFPKGEIKSQQEFGVFKTDSF